MNNYKLPILSDIQKIKIQPGMLFKCKVLVNCTNNSSEYRYASGIVMVDKYDRYFLMLICRTEFSINYDPNIGLFYDDFKHLSLYGQPWYLHFDKYPYNFGLSPKLFVVTDIIFGGHQIYESNCDVYNIDNSIQKNYVYTPSLDCKCFKIQKYSTTYSTDSPYKQLDSLQQSNKKLHPLCVGCIRRTE